MILETYRGVNVLILWSAALERGYVSPYWLTFNQAGKLGANVRKGERGEIVVYCGRGTRKRVDEGGAEVEDAFRFLKWYVVFSADQIDNLPARFHPAPADLAMLPITAHEVWFAGLDIKRILTQNIACYIPSRDVIGMPPVAAFDTAEDYAATLNHESVHATMPAHRVGRDVGKKFSEHALAAEELLRSPLAAWAHICGCRRITFTITLPILDIG